MRWSFKLVRVAGIDILVHATFLMLLAWIGLGELLAGHGAVAALEGVFFVALIFGIVVLHELGHALTARAFGILTRDITLLPIGGVARLERIPENPAQELLVALAGPAVNVALAALCFAALVATAQAAYPPAAELKGVPLLARLLWINVGMAVFNMIPAFPMDGGRVLRAVLAMGMDRVRATETAAKIGQGIALVFGLLGLLFNPLLMLIAAFVWIGASQEAAMVQLKAALSGILVRAAMITEFHALSPDDTLGRVVAHLLEGFQHDFPVVESGQLVGILTREELFKALARGAGKSAFVRDAMHTRFETADPAEMLDQAFARLQSGACPSLPVVRDGRILGIVTRENLGELMMVRSVLREGTRAKLSEPRPQNELAAG